MTPREKWFERSFDFTLPTSRFPSLVGRLRGTAARLDERTRALSADVLTRRVDGRWSILENVGHLIDLEPLWLRRAEQFLANESELVPADLTNRRTHEANHNGRRLADLLAEFRVARSRLVQLMVTADATILARTALHPRLRTPMRLVDLALFVAEHDDHHLADIAELSGFSPPLQESQPRLSVACRAARSEEVPGLAAFAQRIFTVHVAPAYTAEGVATFARYASASAMSGRQGNHRLVVAESAGTLVGLLEIRDESHIAMLFVETAFHRQGVARRLLEAGFGPDGDWPTLTVNSAPGSEGAYARLGFVAAGPAEERDGMRFLPMCRASPGSRSVSSRAARAEAPQPRDG